MCVCACSCLWILSTRVRNNSLFIWSRGLMDWLFHQLAWGGSIHFFTFALDLNLAPDRFLEQTRKLSLLLTAVSLDGTHRRCSPHSIGSWDWEWGQTRLGAPVRRLIHQGRQVTDERSPESCKNLCAKRISSMERLQEWIRGGVMCEFVERGKTCARLWWSSNLRRSKVM